MVWDIEIGERIDGRAALQSRVGGGSLQDGITRIAATDEMLVFTRGSGAQHGYSLHEGLRADGVFRYSGQGRTGDQTLRGNNRSLAESGVRGRDIHVFHAQGKTLTYVGKFTLDSPPYEWERFEESEVSAGRAGIVFNLVPVNADVSLLPALVETGTASTSSGYDTAVSRASNVWRPLDFSTYRKAAIAAGLTSSDVSRVEFALQTRFGEWLLARGDDVRSLPLREHGVTMYPDLYNRTTGEVFEAKRSPARAFVRTAIGQVLDYAAIATRQGIVVTPSVLFPSAPTAELMGLCYSVGIRVWWEEGDGFESVSP